MGYLHIDNLYKNQDILLFKECYALEKIHGTSAHVSWFNGDLRFSPGGESQSRFAACFDREELSEKFAQLGLHTVIVYGEAYGGRCMRMSHVYGKDLRFVAFDVKVDENWVSVPDMDEIARGLGLDVVDWTRVSTDLGALDAERDKPSVQAARNGCGEDQPREGVILRPLIEVTKNNSARIIAKHKQEAFSERATPQKVVDPETLRVLEEADAIAQEWVTEMRMTHVLDKLGATQIEQIREVINAMIEDVLREAAGEIIDSKEARKAISKRAAKMYKGRLNQSISR